MPSKVSVHPRSTANYLAGQKIADLPVAATTLDACRCLTGWAKLYVSVGSQSNVDEEPLPRASVQVMNLDGSNQQTFASGLRNNRAFHPITGELYATVNERDKLGDDLVPDYPRVCNRAILRLALCLPNTK